MLHQERERALSFGTDPDLYHRTRPSYPDSLVDYLMGGRATEVLDVGCGTGIASALFRARGCQVFGVEADERMAAYARGHGLDVDTARFEDWDPAGRLFDLVMSAQAWHWVDPYQGARKAAQVLKAGGRVGLFWNRAIHPENVQAGLDAIYTEVAPGLEGYSIVLGQGTGDRFDVAAAGLEAAGAFGPVETSRFRWTATYTTEKWLDHLGTHSDHRALAAGDRQRLFAGVGQMINGLGGSFSTAYETVLITAQHLSGLPA